MGVVMSCCCLSDGRSRCGRTTFLFARCLFQQVLFIRLEVEKKVSRSQE